jgi:acetyl esterase/lipase
MLAAVALAFAAAAIEIPVHPLAAQTPAAGTRKKKTEELPSQEAVLGKNTVAKLNVAYGDDEKQRLDVYSPKGVKDAPVVVFFHRGEWTRGDKSEVSYKPKFLNENGIVFVAANYRLSPAVAHPAHICDVADAVCWVHDHAAEIGASPQKMVIMGHSAGCHLVTLLALDPRYLAGDGLRPTDLRGVIAWSGGAYDLVAKVKAGGTYAPYIRQAFGNSEATWRDASPVAHVGDSQPLPPFLFVSVEKGNASNQAAENLAGLIRSAKGRADCRLLENRTHMTAIHLVGAPGDATGAILLDFVRRVTR